MSGQIVTEKEVEKALDFLRDSATAIGEAKAEAVRTDHMLKHVKALVMAQHLDKPISAQEREANASNEFKQALQAAAAAAGEFERLKAIREAAALKLECWRSESANFRAMKIG